ncbi:MAG: YaiO family outer membrane beta-barrel protein [Desulfobacterales bacterium]|nr:YaiO family outer membrane beta-barrel protein [Desulfobacterales bacterium]
MTNRRILLLFILLPCLLAVSTGPLAADQGYEETMERARELRINGHFQESKKIYDTVLERNPEDVDALVGRGYCLLALGSSARALEDFSKAVDLAPDYVDAYVGQAKVRKRRGKWREAEEDLRECREALEGDEEKLRYLAKSAWREGFFRLARRLDREYPPEPSRELIERQNTMYLTYAYDWVEDRDNWRMERTTFVRRARPDLSWWVSLARYHRYGQQDNEVGAGAAYRFSHRVGVSYDGFLSNGNDFLADQRHQPKLRYALLPSTSVGIGADLLEYEGSWATLARLELEQGMGNWYGKYTLLAGRDSNNRYVDTSVFEIGYRREKSYRFRLGFSSGEESVEEGGAAHFSEDEIRSVYLGGRYLFAPAWGVTGSISREWRSSELFRTSASLSVFLRF